MLAPYARFEHSTLKWLLGALLITIPLYPKFPLFNIPGIYVAVRAEDFLILLIGLFLFFKIISNPKVFLGSKINQALFIFFAVGFVSVLSGVFVTHTIFPHIGLLHWVRRIEYVIPFFAAILLYRAEYSRFFVHTLVVVSVFVFLYALGQMHLGLPVISTQNYEFSKGLALQWLPGARLHSTFGGHYDLAAFLVIILPIFWAFFFVAKSNLSRLFVFIGIAASFWLLVAASSRISIAAYFVGVGVALWVLRRRLFIIPVFAMSLIIMFTMGDLASRYRYSIESLFSRVPIIQEKESFVVKPVFAEENFVAPKRRSTATPEPKGSPVVEDRSTEIRLNVEWPRAIRALMRNPLLGTGYSSITLATDNDYLRLLGEVGILGFLAFMLALTRIGKKLLMFVFSQKGEITPERAFVSGSLGAFAAILVNASFIDVFEASKVALVFWAILGIAIAIPNQRINANNS